MPWSDSELERHDRYAAIETAAMRRAVAEALAARLAAEAEEARRKNSQAGKIKSASAAPPMEHAPAAPTPVVVAAAAKPGWSTQVIFDVAQDGDSDLSEASDEVPPAELELEVGPASHGWLGRTFSSLEDPNFRLLYAGNILQFGSMAMQGSILTPVRSRMCIRIFFRKALLSARGFMRLMPSSAR